MNSFEDTPVILREFLIYHESIRGHSPKTVNEYYFDLRMFFRFLKMHRKLISATNDWESIDIIDIDRSFIQSVTLSEVYAFLAYLSRQRTPKRTGVQTGAGLSASARARKVASIRSFFKYASNKAHIIEENPVLELDSPRAKKSLPRYLSERESIRLLESIDGDYRERDYAIITLFLNCGLRISELQGLNLADIKEETVRVLGKGNKERVLFLNDACIYALQEYLMVRPNIAGEKALFLSRRLQRISIQSIHVLVKKHLGAAGLDRDKYSSHKLRHTAATLMLGNGVDVRTLQEVLGHDHLNTTQIYTHIESSELRSAAKANPLGKIKPAKKKEPGKSE